MKIAIERPSAGSLRDPVRRRRHTFPPPESFAALLQLTLQLALLVRYRVQECHRVPELLHHLITYKVTLGNQ